MKNKFQETQSLIATTSLESYLYLVYLAHGEYIYEQELHIKCNDFASKFQFCFDCL
jgi:hypothetical protein